MDLTRQSLVHDESEQCPSDGAISVLDHASQVELQRAHSCELILASVSLRRASVSLGQASVSLVWASV